MANINVDSLFEAFNQYDTPTICNAIEVAQGKRGFSGFTRKNICASRPEAGVVVGYARTAKIAAARPSDEPSETIRARRMDYFRSMAEGPRPAIAVIEDEDYPNCVGAWWGEVHWNVHKGLGLSGALTNGLMRDLDAMGPEFPVFAGGIGPSHAFVHVREIGTPVEVFGLIVNEGDLIHADRHGALVIPPDVLSMLGGAIDKLVATEQLIIGPAREADFNIEKLEAAWAAFERART